MRSPQFFAYGAITLYGAPFLNASAKHWICNSVKGLVPLLICPTTPTQQRHQAIALGWFRLLPFSLAATKGVAVAFLSSGYLDVSIPPVPSADPMCSGRSHTLLGMGFPHSDIHGSTLGRQLPVAFRSLPRPSSAPGAKASTVGSL